MPYLYPNWLEASLAEIARSYQKALREAATRLLQFLELPFRPKAACSTFSGAKLSRSI